MTTADTAVMERKRLQDRVPIDAITADARQASPGRTLQGLIGGLFFLVGYVVAKTFYVLFISGAWCASATKMGWRTARGEELQEPNLEQVLEENRMLRLEIERMNLRG